MQILQTILVYISKLNQIMPTVPKSTLYLQPPEPIMKIFHKQTTHNQNIRAFPKKKKKNAPAEKNFPFDGGAATVSESVGVGTGGRPVQKAAAVTVAANKGVTKRGRDERARTRMHPRVRYLQV